MRSLSIALLTFVLALALTTTGFAEEAKTGPQRKGRHGPGCHARQHKGAPLQRLIAQKEAMGLSAEQVEKLTAIQAEAQKKHEALRAAVQKAHEGLRTAAQAQPLDEAAIRVAAEAVGKALGDVAVFRATTQAAVKQVLTEEQNKKLATLCAERCKQGHGEGRACHGKGGRGRCRHNGKGHGGQGRGCLAPGAEKADK